LEDMKPNDHLSYDKDGQIWMVIKITDSTGSEVNSGTQTMNALRRQEVEVLSRFDGIRYCWYLMEDAPQKPKKFDKATAEKNGKNVYTRQRNGTDVE